MNYQEFCINQIINALNQGLTDKQLESAPYKYTLKNGTLGLYAETYSMNGKEFRFFDIDFGSRAYKGKRYGKTYLAAFRLMNYVRRLRKS